MDNVNSEFKLGSGATLLVTPAPFVAAKALHDAVLREFLAAGGQEKDLMDVNISRLVVMASASKDVESAMFLCAETAVYSPDGSDAGRRKVTKALFDDVVNAPKAREDFLVICARIAEVNLRPFFGALFSVLKIFSPVKPAASPQ